jgi:hypothetical protein
MCQAMGSQPAMEGGPRVVVLAPCAQRKHARLLDLTMDWRWLADQVDPKCIVWPWLNLFFVTILQ